MTYSFDKGKLFARIFGILVLLAGCVGVYNFITASDDVIQLFWLVEASFSVPIGLMFTVNTSWLPRKDKPYEKWIGTCVFILLFAIFLFGLFKLFTLRELFFQACESSGGVLKSDGPLKSIASCWHGSEKMTAVDWVFNR